MIWVSRLRLPGTEGTIRENRMYVFIDFGNGEGNWRRIDDIPATARSFSGEPPTGLFIPQNEFGIVWQEQGFTEDLGWATSAGGRAFTTEWQWQAGESGAAVAYVRTADGEIIELYGSNRGGWRYLNE